GTTSAGTASTAGDDASTGSSGPGGPTGTGPLDGSSGEATTEPGDTTAGACNPPCDPLTTVCEAGQCVPPGPPSAGQVVITELMPNPAIATDDDGEWIELANVGTEPVDLEGCVLYDDASDEDVVNTGAPLVVPPGDRAVFAKVADVALNGGVPGVVYAFGTSYTLANAGDEVRLECDGAVIDRVVYLDTWPFADGVAMQLSAASLDATANDDSASWCMATTAYGSGDLGTPGQANAGC
ncbi:MAG: lamin tail domain-containing protein, partial [Myxococcales bacterium]|nr:lamin tail domain-containing protein [Myxococcales bacterium]